MLDVDDDDVLFPGRRRKWKSSKRQRWWLSSWIESWIGNPNLSGRLVSTLVLTRNNKPSVPSHSLLTGRVSTFRLKNLDWKPYRRDLLTALDTYWRKGSNYVQIAIGIHQSWCKGSWLKFSRSGARDGLLFWPRKLRHRWVASKGSLRSGQVQYILLLWA